MTFLLRAPPLEMRRECREFFPDDAGKGTLISSCKAETGLLLMFVGPSFFLSSGGILSLRVRERILGVPVASQEEALSKERREVLQGRDTIPRVPQMLSPFQGNLFSLLCLDFQAED